MNTDKIYAEQIANQYAPKDASKVVALRKLDARATLPANVFTYTLGIASALIFGTGMCLAMGQIGSLTAWSLFLLNIPMGGMIVLMAAADNGYSYPGYVIYISAMYTFYTMIMSVVNLVRYRRLGSPVLSAAKALNFIAALMPVLGMQTAMIAEFSAEDDGFRRLMNSITGAAVWVTVIVTAVYMLIRSSKMKQAAGVNRSTFYLHYETVADLLAESSQYIIRQFTESMPQDTVDFLEKLPTRPLDELYLITPEYLAPYLNYIREHKRIFRTTIEQASALQMTEAYNALNRHVFVPILERFNVCRQTTINILCRFT